MDHWGCSSVVKVTGIPNLGCQGGQPALDSSLGGQTRLYGPCTATGKANPALFRDRRDPRGVFSVVRLPGSAVLVATGVIQRRMTMSVVIRGSGGCPGCPVKQAQPCERNRTDGFCPVSQEDMSGAS